MTLHTYDVPQKSDAWHDLRRGIVTASEMSGLITPTLKVAANIESRSLAYRLVAERITGYTDPTYMSDDMMRGIEDEPRARDKYSEKYADVHQLGLMVRDFDVEGVSFSIGFSPDGLVGDVGQIEVKSRRQDKHLATILSDTVPNEYMAQIQTGLLVSGRSWCDFVSFSGGMPMWVRRVYPDPDWRGAILDAVAAFEQAAVGMVANYRTAVIGLPMTERIEMAVVI